METIETGNNTNDTHRGFTTTLMTVVHKLTKYNSFNNSFNWPSIQVIQSVDITMWQHDVSELVSYVVAVVHLRLSRRNLLLEHLQYNTPSNAQNPLQMFPHNFSADGELLATSRCNGIWETTWHNRHNGLLPAPTCYRLVADLLCGSCQFVTDLLRGNWCNGFWP